MRMKIFFADWLLVHYSVQLHANRPESCARGGEHTRRLSSINRASGTASAACRPAAMSTCSKNRSGIVSRYSFQAGVAPLPILDDDAGVPPLVGSLAGNSAAHGMRLRVQFLPSCTMSSRSLACSSCGPGSRLACCCCCERRCDARVRLQQRGCGVPSFALRIGKRSLATLQQRGWAWVRQADP